MKYLLHFMNFLRHAFNLCISIFSPQGIKNADEVELKMIATDPDDIMHTAWQI